MVRWDTVGDGHCFDGAVVAKVHIQCGGGETLLAVEEYVVVTAGYWCSGKFTVVQ